MKIFLQLIVWLTLFSSFSLHSMEAKNHYSALLNAIKTKNIDAVKEAIEAKVDINKLTEEGERPLNLAIISGFNAIATLLINNGANIDAQDYHLGRTPLMIASRNNNKEIAEVLINNGANIDAQDYYGQTALIHAFSHNNKDIVELLINNGADLEGKDIHGLTAFLSATKAGYKDIVELLLNKNANRAAEDERGRTALMIATEAGNKDIVELLLNKNANREEKDNRGQTALMIASKVGNKDIVTLLLKNGANVNEKNREGQTALTIATEAGNKDIVELLLNNGADIEARALFSQYRFEYTPLMIASVNGNQDIVELLLNKGANIEAKDNRGLTSLELASRRSQQNIVTLIKNKASELKIFLLNALDNEDFATINKIVPQFDWTIPEDVVNSSVDNQGNTQLHKFIKKGNFEVGSMNYYIIKYMLSSRPKPVQNNAGETALEVGLGLWRNDKNFENLLDEMLLKQHLDHEIVRTVFAKINAAIQKDIAEGKKQVAELQKLVELQKKATT